MDHYLKFKQILEKYDLLFKKDLEKGSLPMRSTKHGFWGTASIYAVYEFFNKLKLDKYSHFLDLGSGDGRVVLLASLFTKSTGIECDKDLINLSKSVRDKLGLKANFHLENYMNHDLSKYDVVFIYPDKGFTHEFEQKLREVKGPIFIYNKIYLPNSLKKSETYWVEEMPLIRYDNA